LDFHSGASFLAAEFGATLRRLRIAVSVRAPRRV